MKRIFFGGNSIIPPGNLPNSLEGRNFPFVNSRAFRLLSTRAGISHITT